MQNSGRRQPKRGAAGQNHNERHDELSYHFRKDGEITQVSANSSLLLHAPGAAQGPGLEFRVRERTLALRETSGLIQ